MNRLYGLWLVLLAAVACDDDVCAKAGACPEPGGGGGGGILEPAGGAAAAGGGSTGGTGGESAMGGSAGDGGQGGGEPLSTLATVTVSEYLAGPSLGFDIIANGPDGALVDAGVTGADGTVQVEVPAGGSVSLAYTRTYESNNVLQTERNLETVFFEGLAPDEINLVAYFDDEEPEKDETMTQGFVFPERPGATSYVLSASCYTAYPSPLVYVNDSARDCTSDGLYDVLLLARDPNGTIIDYARLDDLVYVPGGSSLNGLAWTNEPIDSITFELGNIPTVANAVYVGTYAQELQGARGPAASASASANEPANDLELVLQHLSQYGNHHCEYAGVQIYDDQDGRASVGKRRCSPSADLSTFAFDVSRLARFEPLTSAESPLVLAWDEVWPGEFGDMLTVYGVWQHDEDEYAVWHGYLSPNRTSAPFPELPATLAEYGYLPNDTLLETSAYHQDFDDLPGFDDVVAMGLPLFVALNGEDTYVGVYP